LILLKVDLQIDLQQAGREAPPPQLPSFPLSHRLTRAPIQIVFGGNAMKLIPLLPACILAAASLLAHADFTYQESTQITGGSVVAMMKLAGTFSRQARQANDSVLTTVTVKGNHMARSTPDHTEIIDLDAGTITSIDHLKKQYTVLTFDQMRQQMAAAMAKARTQQAQQPHPEPVADTNPQVDVKFTVKVRSTDASRDVAGLSAKESILTMTADATDRQSGQTGSFAVTNDMFLAPDIPGYEEVRDFYRRYALKMGTVFSGALNTQSMAMMQQPAAGKAMVDMVAEMSKLKGIPVLQILRMGTTLNGSPLPAASEAPLPPPPPTPSAGDVARQSASSAVMNSLPFGGFGRKKPSPPPPADTDTANSAPPTSLVLIESSTQLTSFSQSSIDAVQFLPPAAYRQIDPRPLD
jgi:hypothetical protein